MGNRSMFPIVPYDHHLRWRREVVSRSSGWYDEDGWLSQNSLGF